jgi:hypothetical protein
MRVQSFVFSDAQSEKLWERIVGKKVNLVPVRTATQKRREQKTREIRKYYQCHGPLAFVHVDLLDNRSEFISRPVVRIREEDGNFVIHVRQAIAIANTIAYLSELVDPVAIFLGLSRKNLMMQALRYLVVGEGETGLLVYTILVRYWDWTPEDDVRPLIFMMSD